MSSTNPLPRGGEAGDAPPPTTQPHILTLFASERVTGSQVALLAWLPFGAVLAILRLFVGFHAFVVACVLRKANWLRGLVLRVMCALCGVVVTSDGEPDPKARLFVANHVSTVDHLAVDLLQPCVLASVWDIPNLLRWAFGYVDLGAREGRAELVKQARDFTEKDDLPLLTFPESALTSGKTGLLRFAAWPFEVVDSLQPLAIRVSRPIGVEPSVMGAAWWQDLAWFAVLPWSTIHVTWMPKATRATNETPEDFALRVSQDVARELGIMVTEYTSHDAVEAAKKHLRAREAAAASKPRPRPRLSPAKLDECAMVIKQSHPSLPVIDIRRDLEITNDPRLTIERIKTGVLKASAPPIVSAKKTLASSSLSDPTEWRRLYEERKWAMIEMNRAKYLERAEKEREHSGSLASS